MPIKKVKSKKPKTKKPKAKPKAKAKPKQNIILKQIEDAYKKILVSSIPRYEDIQRSGANYIVSPPPQQIYVGKGIIPEGTDNKQLQKYYDALIMSNKKITKKDFQKMTPEEKEAYVFTFEEMLGAEATLDFKKRMGILNPIEKENLKYAEDFDKMVNEIYKQEKESKSKNPLSKSPFEDVEQKLKTPKNDYDKLNNKKKDDDNLNNLETPVKYNYDLPKRPFEDAPQKLKTPTNDYEELDYIEKDDDNLNNLEDPEKYKYSLSPRVRQTLRKTGDLGVL
jgi:hypothetical protein